MYDTSVSTVKPKPDLTASDEQIRELPYRDI